MAVSQHQATACLRATVSSWATARDSQRLASNGHHTSAHKVALVTALVPQDHHSVSVELLVFQEFRARKVLLLVLVALEPLERWARDPVSDLDLQTINLGNMPLVPMHKAVALINLGTLPLVPMAHRAVALVPMWSASFQDQVDVVTKQIR